jgi:hypothetical protein
MPFQPSWRSNIAARPRKLCRAPQLSTGANSQQELEERTRELAQSVDERHAPGEVSQTDSSSLDLQEVLTTIVSRATRHTGADGGMVDELGTDTRQCALRAAYLMPDQLVTAIQASRPGPDDNTTLGRAVRASAAIQFRDLAQEPDTPMFDALLRAGHCDGVDRRRAGAYATD